MPSVWLGTATDGIGMDRQRDRWHGDACGHMSLAYASLETSDATGYARIEMATRALEMPRRTTPTDSTPRHCKGARHARIRIPWHVYTICPRVLEKRSRQAQPHVRKCTLFAMCVREMAIGYTNSLHHANAGLETLKCGSAKQKKSFSRQPFLKKFAMHFIAFVRTTPMFCSVCVCVCERETRREKERGNVRMYVWECRRIIFWVECGATCNVVLHAMWCCIQ